MMHTFTGFLRSPTSISLFMSKWLLVKSNGEARYRVQAVRVMCAKLLLFVSLKLAGPVQLNRLEVGICIISCWFR